MNSKRWRTGDGSPEDLESQAIEREKAESAAPEFHDHTEPERKRGAAAEVRAMIADRVWAMSRTPDAYRRMGDVLDEHAEMAALLADVLDAYDEPDPFAYDNVWDWPAFAEKVRALLARIRGEA